MSRKIPQVDASPEPWPEADDFKRIPGIGPVIERHLHEAGIRTFGQLAALSHDQIAEIVAHLPLLSTERIVRQDWPGRARALAGETVALAAAPPGAAASGKRYATFTVELLLDAYDGVIHTRMVHLQNGVEEAWDGWSADRLLTFFGAYALNIDPVGEAAPGGRGPISVDASQVAMSGKAVSVAEQDSGDLPAGLRLALDELLVEAGFEDAPGGPEEGAGLWTRLSFSLSGTGAGQIATAGTPYSVAILASEVDSGAVFMIGAHNGRLRPGQEQYRMIVELAPPHEGSFQLLGVVIVQAGLVQSALGPVLHVVA